MKILGDKHELEEGKETW